MSNIVRISRITCDSHLLALVNNMYEMTSDIQFKLMMINWLEKDEVTELLKIEPIPQSLISWLLSIAEDPYPITLVELIVILFKHELNKSMLECLQMCVRSELFPFSVQS